jgi:hypothetical protein
MNMVLLFTLLEVLIVVAIIVILGALFFAQWFKAKTGPAKPASIKLNWITKPPDFPKNTPTTYVVQLVRVNAKNGAETPMGEEGSFVGAVSPASVKIVTINGAQPASPVTVPEFNDISAYEVETDVGGNITIVLEGAEVEEAGELITVYVVSATDVKTAKANFMVTD